jgi:hypothetical protein
MECDRFEEVFREWEAARLDPTLRARLNDDTELVRSWRNSMDDGDMSDRPTRVASVLLWMQVTIEMSLLLVAVRNPAACPAAIARAPANRDDR